MTRRSHQLTSGHETQKGLDSKTDGLKERPPVIKRLRLERAHTRLGARARGSECIQCQYQGHWTWKRHQHEIPMNRQLHSIAMTWEQQEISQVPYNLQLSCYHLLSVEHQTITKDHFASLPTAWPTTSLSTTSTISLSKPIKLVTRHLPINTSSDDITPASGSWATMS
jgi:hypothetical protein